MIVRRAHDHEAHELPFMRERMELRPDACPDPVRTLRYNRAVPARAVHGVVLRCFALVTHDVHGMSHAMARSEVHVVSAALPTMVLLTALAALITTTTRLLVVTAVSASVTVVYVISRPPRLGPPLKASDILS